nr:uncharacterized protein LOC123771649 [Procambarus clarkii]
MSDEVGINELLQAHRGLNDIISATYPADADEGPINVFASLTHSCNSSSEVPVINSFLEDITALTGSRQELADVVEKISVATLNENSSALTDPELLGRRLAWFQQAEQHIRSIIENKDLITYRLQQPLVFNFLTMHYHYHKDLISLIGQLVDLLNNVPSHIRLLEDRAQHSILERSDSCISSLTHGVTALRNTLDDVVKLQSLVKGILDAQE